jgi:hypothetical protein
LDITYALGFQRMNIAHGYAELYRFGRYDQLVIETDNQLPIVDFGFDPWYHVIFCINFHAFLRSLLQG